MPEENNQMVPGDGEEMESNRNPRRRAERTAAEVGVLEIPDERHDFSRIVLPNGVKASVEVALHRFAMAEQLEAVWGLSRIEPNPGKCVLNFYGPPGTGKTLTAGAVAKRLGKPLYRVDYSAVISKYLGDTAKYIVRAFRESTEEDAVLFFDEADSLVSRRVSSSETCSTSINQNRNVLMGEIDRFTGIVIMTTNLFENYDPAMLRRISRHIQFSLPNRSQRLALLKEHLPNMDRVRADLQAIAISARGLSGGDIRNVCLNAIYAASMSHNPSDWLIEDKHLAAEVEAVKVAKQNNEIQQSGEALVGTM